jgi:hypothetical protein
MWKELTKSTLLLICAATSLRSAPPPGNGVEVDSTLRSLLLHPQIYNPTPASGTLVFTAIKSDTNTIAAMHVSTGASLDATGSGTINATAVTGVADDRGGAAYNIMADGAVCDGTTDDSSAIQTTYNRMTSAVQGTIVWPTNKTCKLTNTITLTNAQSVQIMGGHVTWIASAMKPIFQYISDRNVTTAGFFVQRGPAPSAIGTAFQIQEDVGVRYGISSGNIFIGNVIEGVAAGGLNIGFEMKPGTAGDVNNDEMRFYSNEVRNYTTAGWQIDHTQSKDHNFYGNQCYGNRTGATCVNEIKGTRIYWSGGFVGGNTDADFVLNNNASEPQTIEGVTSEGSNRFVRYGSGPFGTPSPLNLIDDDFSTDSLNADKHIVLYYAPGPLNVLGGNYGRTGKVGDFSWEQSTASSTIVYGIVLGVSFSAAGSNGRLPVSYGASTPHILMATNTYTNASSVIAAPTFVEPFSAASYAVYGVASIYYVTSDFTTAANTDLQNITGLSWTVPSSTAMNIPFSCHLAYSQASGTAAVAFGIQDVTVSPTNIFVTGMINTNTTASAWGNLSTLTTTSATSIVSAMPSATSTIRNADLNGFIQQPSNASTTAINIMVSTAISGDAVTVRQGSFCRIN